MRKCSQACILTAFTADLLNDMGEPVRGMIGILNALFGRCLRPSGPIRRRWGPITTY